MKILEHVLAILLGLGMLAAGGAKLAGVEQLAQNFARWGYPGWFLYLTGVIEIVAGIGVAVPKTRLPGSAIVAGTMIGATVTHIRAGEGVGETIPALLHLLVAIGVAALVIRRRRA